MSRIIEKGAPRGRTEPEPVPDEVEDQQAPLPVLRLRRLGVTDELVDHLAEMWGHLDDAQAAATAEAMREMSDRGLLVALVGEPEDGQDPQAWVDANQFPVDAARVLTMPF